MPDHLTVSVPLARSPYEVHVGPGLVGELGEILQPLGLKKRVAVISDETVAGLHGTVVLEAIKAAGYEAELFEVPPGEGSKRLDLVARLCEELAEAGHDRGSWVAALGGGVVGDLAGFVAAVFYRGIDFVQLPTTVLAQVDSSVGGKTGVNLAAGKNLAGAFHQPRTVVADTDWLGTLPQVTFAEGFAEVIKHAAIRDPEMLDRLAGLVPASPDLAGLMARNVAIKAAVVVEDEKETSGTRAFLNFGHTIGHAIEAAAGYGEMLHGEAISLGLRAALFLSGRVCGLEPGFPARVLAALAAFDLPLVLPDDERFGTDQLLALMARDKKFQSGTNRFVLLKAPGSPVLVDGVEEALVREAIEELRRSC